ncbi:MAG: arylsulfatase A-like enzyme [Gammaproteobacteria bacterium]|jgi:arylsulfatase A-like enzyme
MTQRKNILFIMCDQLRFDYLSCYGHPHLATPNVDSLAANGVRFTNAYCQSPVCGSSRMSFYTGRYVDSHGVSYNGFPLRVGERTMGDYLRDLGVQTALVGKTHMKADEEGMARLGIEADSIIGTRVAECGFDPFERDDGLYGVGPAGAYDPNEPRYNDYLRDQGFAGKNPWSEWANAAEDENGEILSGWFMRHAVRPARVDESHSETPYMTRRAMAFIDHAGDTPWCLHLSYIKPHWPYIVPAPYHDMFSKADVLPPLRTEAERATTHPVYAAYMEHRVSKVFSRPQVRDAVIPAYMGLVKQIDDQLGVLFEHLRDNGLWENTMVVFSSDHGDYLGDHWLGEKDHFHDVSVKIPMLVYDPSAEADVSRGTVCDALVESIDLLPTFIDWHGGEAQPHRLEGRSLLPWLHTPPRAYEDIDWREVAISEYDYSMMNASSALDVLPSDARMVMAVDLRWKYIEILGFRPMLFDRDNDPGELEDLGDDPAYADIRAAFAEKIARWARRLSQRTTISDDQILARRGRSAQRGIFIGYWDEAELPDDVAQFLAREP